MMGEFCAVEVQSLQLKLDWPKAPISHAYR